MYLVHIYIYTYIYTDWPAQKRRTINDENGSADIFVHQFNRKFNLMEYTDEHKAPNDSLELLFSFKIIIIFCFYIVAVVGRLFVDDVGRVISYITS